MELTAVSQMGRRSRAAITAIPPGNSPQKSGTIPQADRLSLSRQTASFLQEQDRLAQEVTKIIQRFTDNGETEKQGMTEDEMLAEELKVKERCQKIMSRLMKGDKVPPKDMQYLAQNDMEAYKLAMAARMMAPKKKPKEWESVLKDEEEQSGGAETGSDVSGSTEGAAETSDGGEAGAE